MIALLFAVSYAQTVPCSSNDDCQDFCDFDNGSSGFCELCANIENGCANDGFDTTEGEQACVETCESVINWLPALIYTTAMPDSDAKEVEVGAESTEPADQCPEDFSCGDACPDGIPESCSALQD